MLTHLNKECPHVNATCPMNCGKIFPRSKWEKHFDEECTMVEIPCPTCDELLKKPNFAGHNCVKHMKG